MENKINFVFYLRDWDKNAFPLANKGFFNFKKNIPELLNKIELTKTYIRVPSNKSS